MQISSATASLAAGASQQDVGASVGLFRRWDCSRGTPASILLPPCIIGPVVLEALLSRRPDPRGCSHCLKSDALHWLLPDFFGNHWHGFLVFKMGIFIIRPFFCRLPFSATYVSDYRDWRWHVKLQTPKDIPTHDISDNRMILCQRCLTILQDDAKAHVIQQLADQPIHIRDSGQKLLKYHFL